MQHIKRLAWLLCFLLAWALIALAMWHSQLQHLGAHRKLLLYFLLAVALMVPARFLALAGSYVVELLLVGWSRSSLRALWKPSPSVRMDIVATCIQTVLPHRYLGYVFSFGLLYAIDVFTPRLQPWSATHLLPTWGLQLVCFIALQSFLRYWMHRLEHTIPALWALHKFHHSADSMSLLTTARNTDLTTGIETAVVLLPAALLTQPTATMPALGSAAFAMTLIYVAYRTFIGVNGYFVHSNMTTGYGWVGRWLLVSPRMHRLHHAKSATYHDKNFTFDLVIWDRLFGTYATCPAEIDPLTIPLGLEENPFNGHRTVAEALSEYFLRTYLVFWQELRKGLAAWLPESTAAARRIPRLTGSS